jgi:hypothetical protein
MTTPYIKLDSAEVKEDLIDNRVSARDGQGRQEGRGGAGRREEVRSAGN